MFSDVRSCRFGLLATLAVVVQPAIGGDIDTYAGTGVAGYSGDGGPATGAEIWNPWGITVAANGDIYFADRGNNVVRKVDAATGDISTVAGGGSPLIGDGSPATSAWFNTPQAVTVDAVDNVYIADSQNHRIRKVDAGTGLISTIAGTGVAGYGGDGGPAVNALLNSPRGVAVDSAGNVIFSDTNNHRIRLITPGGTVTTVAGSGMQGFLGDGGLATAARLNEPYGIAMDDNDVIYFADRGNNRIRKFTVGGNISTVGGDGTAAYGGDGGLAINASLQGPRDVCVDRDGRFGFDTVFGLQQGKLKDKQNATQIVLTENGTATEITAYIKSKANNDVRYAIYTDLAGEPDALLVETAATTAPNGTGWFTITVPPTVIAPGIYWLALSLDANSQKYQYDAAGGQTRENANAAVTNGYNANWGVATASTTRRMAIYATLTTATTTIYVADTGNHRIREFLEGGNIATVAGTGVGGFGGDGGAATVAQLDEPLAVSVNGADDLFIADEQNHRIRMVDYATGNISTFGGAGTIGYSGDGGAATAAEMYEPRGVFVDRSGNVYLGDSRNHVVRVIDGSTGVITLVAGTPRDSGVEDGVLATSVFLNTIEDVAIDDAGNLFIAATAQSRVRRVDVGTGLISTIIGSGFEFAPAAATDDVMLLDPRSVAVDTDGNVYVADSDPANSRVVQYTVADSTYATVAGTGQMGFSGDIGPAAEAQINQPRGIAIDVDDNIYIADTLNHRIRRVDAGTSNIATIAGTGVAGYSGDGASATAAQLNTPERIAVDTAGNVYLTDTNNHRIRRVAQSSGNIDTIVGTGAPGFGGDGGSSEAALINGPRGLAVEPIQLYVSDSLNHRIRLTSVPAILRITSWQEVAPQ